VKKGIGLRPFGEWDIGFESDEMEARFRLKLTLLFFFLFIFFILIQFSLIFLLHCSFLFSSMLAFSIVSPLTYLILRRIIKPIETLTESANRIASGSLDRGLLVESNDELGRLSVAIEEMRRQLMEKIEDISREKDYLRTLLGGMVEGVLVVDEKGKILIANSALRQLLSLPPEIEKRTVLEMLRNVELEEAIQKVLHDGQSETLELRLPEPQKRIFEVNIARVSSPSDRMVMENSGYGSVIAVFHDITRLKELEKIRQDFVANVSHELRTPLTSIKGYVETLLEGALKEEVAYPFLQIIKKHSDRLERIIEDLLMLSKIESHEFRLNKEPLYLSELIREALGVLKESYEKKKMTVWVNETSPILQVNGDRQYLEQVLLNLLDNAVKYGREGGRIEISVKGKDLQQEIEISIKDDGIGIPKEDLGRIFERFYRVDKGRSRELGGTGLGLSIVKHIIQAHGGKVWVESTLGEGSTFYVTLPQFFQNPPF